jgi:hypothetical protein
MVTITRSVVVLSAVVAAALVVAFETTGPRAEVPAATAQVAQRFPVASETFTTVPVTSYVKEKFIAAQKADRPMVSGSCANTPNGWPYVSKECRVASAHVSTPTRS